MYLPINKWVTLFGIPNSLNNCSMTHETHQQARKKWRRCPRLAAGTVILTKKNSALWRIYSCILVVLTINFCFFNKLKKTWLLQLTFFCFLAIFTNADCCFNFLQQISVIIFVFMYSLFFLFWLKSYLPFSKKNCSRKWELVTPSSSFVRITDYRIFWRLYTYACTLHDEQGRS